ncbi:MAG: phosphocholine cytidylyltransferase family protein [Candidatus Eisenbacteria bacterium]
MASNLRVVIVAAGSARRLRPLTDHTPKCLLEVGGQSMIERAVSAFAASGLRAFTVVDGFHGDELRAHLLQRFPSTWFRFARNEEFETTNNAFSLALAAPRSVGSSAHESILVADADLVFDPTVVTRLLGAEYANCLALRSRGGVGEEEMKVRLGDDGRVTDLSKEIPPQTAAGESIGLVRFSAPDAARLFDLLQAAVADGSGRTCYYEAVFVRWLRAGGELHAVDIEELRCMEIDTAEDLDAARRLFSRARS